MITPGLHPTAQLVHSSSLCETIPMECCLLQFSLCHNPASNFELFCFLRTLLVAFKCSKAVLFFDFLACVPLTVALKRGTALVMSAAMGASFITVYHWYAYFFHHLGCHPFVFTFFLLLSPQITRMKRRNILLCEVRINISCSFVVANVPVAKRISKTVYY